MAPRSKIARLPDPVRAWLDKALADSAFADYELLSAELKARGFDISKSAVHRYGQEFEDKLSAIRIATEQARAITDAIPDDAGAMNDALIRLVQQKAFDVLVKMEEGASIKDIGLMVARLSNATVSQKKWQAEAREKVKSRLDALEGEAKTGKGTFDLETLRRVREELYGIV